MDNCWKSACLSRRSVLIAAAGAVPVLALGVTGASATQLSQTAAKYQGSPKDGKQCDGCKFFQSPSSCKTVAGTIAATGYCSLWVKKA